MSGLPKSLLCGSVFTYEDLAHFKALTLDHPILMGRKTFDALRFDFVVYERG